MNLTNVKRWIKASILREIELSKLNYYGTAPVRFFVEGDDRDTNQQDQHFEFRFDGPYSKPLTKNEYRFYIEVNILINSTRNERNIYNIDNLEGVATQLLNRDWCIYKIGNTTDNAEDDGSYFGTMQLMPMEQIKLSSFGQIESDAEVFQSTSEAHYEMYTRS